MRKKIFQLTGVCAVVFQRCVRRLTWKRELARVEAKLKIQNWRMADIENERRVYYECYTNNLQHCSELEAENGRLKEKLAAQKKYVRAANRGAERNAIVSQMLAARLAIRNQQPPNAESSHAASATDNGTFGSREPRRGQ